MSFNHYIDHTILKADAKPEDVRKLCEEAVQNKFMSVCVNGVYAQFARQTLDALEAKVAGTDKAHHVKVCCVVGFPLGAMTTEAKAFEAQSCIEHGAEEIDMVIPVGKMIAGDHTYVVRDVSAVVSVCKKYKAISKVILETCLLTKEQITKASQLSISTGADFIKTSTGFSTGGATEEDVKLMVAVAKPAGKQVKASGGVRSAEDAKKYIELGCTRLGTSSGIAIVQGTKSTSAY